MRKIDTNTLLLALWLFVLLNIVFRDIHQLALKSELEMLLTGSYNGVEITEQLMLLGEFVVLIPISMVLFSVILTRRIGRPVTLAAALITGAVMLSSAPTDMDDVLHLTVEIFAMIAIIWTAWKWPQAVPSNASGTT